jgi:hypothetical protein
LSASGLTCEVVRRYRKVVSVRLLWRDATARHSDRSVLSVGANLEQTMPMQACALIPEAVEEVNDDSVAHIGTYIGTWPLIVDADDDSLLSAVWIATNPSEES